MTTVTGLFDDYQDAANAVSELEAIGVPRDDISIVANNADNRYRQDETSDAVEDAAAGAGLGALVGGAGNVPTASFVLPAGTKVARLINELVPAAVNDDGFVYVRTTNNVPLYGLELFFSRDNRVIANVAAGVLDPSITYTPPAN